MKRHLASGLLLAASLVAPAVAWTADVEWGTVGFVTSTLGNQSGRLCAGAPSTMRPGDFGCPSYAPSITTAGHVSVTGNLSAAQFVGDGSLLTGLNATGDRITSGTASVIVTSATSSISFSTAGSERMSILSNGNVGIGSSNPLAKLVVAGNVDITTGALNIFGGSILSAPATDIMLRPNNGVTALTVKASSGNVGIGTTNPQATLQVSGSFIVSTSAQTTTPSLFVGTNGNVGVGTSAPIGRFEVASGVVNNGGSTKLRLNNMASSVSSRVDLVAGNLSNEFPYFAIETRENGNPYAQIERLRITHAGNVGIGTTAPTRTLDVSGTANISGTMYVASYTTVSGTIKIAGTGDERCDSTQVGTMRFDRATGRLEICRP